MLKYLLAFFALFPSLAACSDDPPISPAFATAPICRTSTNNWQNISTPNYNANFTAELDATPSSSASNGVVGLSNGWAASYDHLATSVRFNTSGKIDAINGTTYGSREVVSYTGGTTYRVRFVVALTAKTYSAFVKVGAGVEDTIAYNYKLRNRQSFIKKINNIGHKATTGTLQVCYGDTTIVPPLPPIDTVSPPTVIALTVTPPSAAVITGDTQQFTATPTWSDGGSHAVTRTWSATGGTVSTGGLYTAGSLPGDYRVIASAGGKADTAEVSVGTSVAGCPSSGYLRLVNVSNKAQLDAAKNAALPGDQIRLAAGTYNYTSEGWTLSRSGTAANPIVYCGPRTAVVNAYAWVRASYVRLTGFRIRGDTPYATVWGIYQTSGGHNVYDHLEVGPQYRSGIVIHDGPSYGNEIAHNYIHDTGVGVANRGECVYIGDGDWDYVNDGHQIVDSTWIHHNTLTNCRAEGIELKSGTSFAVVEFNTITNAGHGLVVGSDAPIQVRANGNIIRDNTITTAPRYGSELYVTPGRESFGGQNNKFQRNHFSGMGNNKAFSLQPGHTGNVYCNDNTYVSPVVANVTTVACP